MRCRRGLDVVNGLSGKENRMHLIAWWLIGSKIVNKSGEGFDFGYHTVRLCSH